AGARQAGALPDGPLLGAGVLLGALPFVHIHTFLVLAGLLVWLALACAMAARRERRSPVRAAAPWLLALLLGVAVASPQLAWQLSHSFGSKFSHWQLAWMAERNEDPFTFW